MVIENSIPQVSHTRTLAAEEMFRLLVESVKDYGIFMLDTNGVIQGWNQGAERIKGYKAEEVIGKHFSIFYTQEDRARHHPEQELAIAIETGRYEEEGWRVRKDGSRFWANIIITKLELGGEFVGFSKVTRDLTERKAVEDKLRASEEHSRLVYEAVKDYAIITLDAQGIVTGWNEGARRIKGYEANEIIGKHFSAFYASEEIETGKCEYELEEAQTTGRFEDEGWRIRKDGTRFWANVVITALYDKNRTLRGFSKVTRDVTEKKRAEDRLRMANEGLERRVIERTNALTSINEKLLNEISERKKAEKELQQAVNARDEFLSIASHELRTPVTPLKLQLQGLLKHLHKGTLAELSTERLAKMAKSIDISIARLGKLIDSLLDVARINAGKIILHPENIDATEVVTSVCESLKHEAQIAGSTIVLEDSQPIIGYFDRLRLEQIVTNLTTNAIKFGNSKPVEISVREDELNLIIQVKDHGIGIAKSDLPKIFNRFEQVGNQMTSNGLGLGLYITKQIVSSQNGTIQVESTLGSGTTFSVLLPRNEVTIQ